MANYVSPEWANDQAPKLNAANMQDITDTVEASQVLEGSGAPTTATVGTVGQLYRNTETTPNTLFRCTAVSGSSYTWEPVPTRSEITSIQSDITDIYSKWLYVVKVTDSTTTMGDINTQLIAINADGDHVVFDVSALNAGMYLCTIFINSGYYRIADLVTGFEGTGFYNAADTLYDIIISGSSTKGDHYTMVWDMVNAQGTRLNAAASITTDITNFAHRGSVNASYDNPFDSIYPWSGRKLCNIDIETYMALTSSDDITDCVTYWEDDAGFSYTDQYGVWVYTPPFYGRSYVIGNNRYFDVTDENLQNNIYYPAQITGRWHGCGVTLTIGGQSKICNLPVCGAMPLKSIAMSTQHSYASNYGGSLTDIYSVDASLLLYAVEYANMNTQNTIGNGVSDLYDQTTLYPSAAVTAGTTVTFTGLTSGQLADFIPGAIIDFGTTSGGAQTASTIITSVSTTGTVTTVEVADAITVTTSTYVSIHGKVSSADEDIGSKSGYIGTNGKSNAYYRGEVLWSNLWQYVLGAYRQTGTSKVWIAASPEAAAAYDALNTSVHTDTGVLLPAGASNYIQTLGMCGGLSIPPFGTSVGGNSSNPVGDYLYVPAATTGNTVLLLGGDALNTANAGAFCGSWNSGSGTSYWHIGSRPRLLNPS